jgi:hypothetical protein
MAWLADCGLGRTVPGQPIEAIVAQHYASLKLAVKFTELINGQNQLLADALAVGAIPSADLLVDVFPLPSGGFYVFAPFPMDSPEFRLWLDAVGRAKIKLANPIFRTFAPI